MWKQLKVIALAMAGGLALSAYSVPAEAHGRSSGYYGGGVRVAVVRHSGPRVVRRGSIGAYRAGFYGWPRAYYPRVYASFGPRTYGYYRYAGYRPVSGFVGYRPAYYRSRICW